MSDRDDVLADRAEDHTCREDETADRARPLGILRRHILPHCQTRWGNLPGEDALAAALDSGRYFMEWTIDAMGPRDWKIDQHESDHRLSVRYRGSDPEAQAAERACNLELTEVLYGG